MLLLYQFQQSTYIWAFQNGYKWAHGLAAKEGKKSNASSTQNETTCAKCDKHFARTDGLATHMQIHTGLYRYYCEICRKGFNNSGNFTQHMRGHRGLKYHCEYCSKAFASKQKYQYHLSDHTGQYRFWCGICLKGFNDKTKYKAHIKSHGQ